MSRTTHGSTLIIGVLLAMGAWAQPPNDDCANAFSMCPNTTVSTNNIFATSECNGPDGDCLSAGAWGQCYDVNNSVWFNFMTNSNGGSVTITISNISCVNPTGNDELQGVLIEAGTPCDASTYTQRDCHPGNNNTFTLTYNTLWPNTLYWVQIDGDSVPSPQAQCTFDITISGPAVDWIVNTQVNNVTCNGGNDGDATVTPQSGFSPYTYQWSDPLSQTTPQATALTAGTYNVTITDSTGCDTVVSVIITEPPPIILAFSSSNASCGSADGSATVNPSNGPPPFLFNWSPGGQTTQTITNISSGVYTVTVTDANGCTQVGSVGVSDIGGPTVTTSFTQVSCNGGCNGTASAVPSGGVPPYTFLWNDPQSQTQGIAIGLCAGVYIVEVTDSNGCKTVVTITVSEPPPIQITMSSNPSGCGTANGDATASASGGTPSYSYQWNDPGSQTGSTATGLAAGTYTVTVTDGNNCTATASVVVGSNNGNFYVTGSSTIVSCNGDNDGTASANASGGSTPYSYQWDNNTGNQTAQTATGLAAGNYNVTVTDNNGCDTTITVTVYEPPPIVISSVVANANCGQPDGAATVSPSGGTPPYSYLWDASTGGQTGQTATGLSAGSYSVTVTAADGCTQTATILVSNIGGPAVTVTTIPVSCYGGNDGSATANPSGTPPYNYLWSSGGTAQTENNLSAGTYILTVIDANNCSTLVFVTITEPEPFIVTVNTTPASCSASDGDATVTISGGAIPYSYNWSTGETTATATGLSAGTYSVTITDGNNCDTIVPVTIIEASAIDSVVIATDGPGCDADNGTAAATPSGGTPPYSYAWDNGQNGQTATGLAAGTFTVTVTDANNCTFVETADVIQSVPPMAIAEPINIGCENQGSIVVQVIGGTPPYSYSLNGDTSSSNIFTELDEGTYTITVVDSKNCRFTATSVSIKDDCIRPEVKPWNAFSPNGDGTNDTWGILNLRLYDNCKVFVYDRWGQKVFKQNGYESGEEWDGKSLGYPVPAATYYYVIYLDKDDKKEGVKTGHVAIVR